MKNTSPQKVLPGLYRFGDTCNVYVVCGQTSSIAIDLGSGRWLKQAKARNLPPIEHVYLMHHHADLCQGLLKLCSHPFIVHTPMGDENFLSPRGVKHFWQHRRDGSIPPSYSVLPRGVSNIHYDMAGVAMNILCPSHGPIVTEQPRRTLVKLAGKLDTFDNVKDSVCAGEKDHYLKPTFTACGVRCLLEGLYQFGKNSYLLDYKALVIDPWRNDIPALNDLLKELRPVHVTAANEPHAPYAPTENSSGTIICIRDSVAFFYVWTHFFGI